jgi:hypothetical protein
MPQTHGDMAVGYAGGEGRVKGNADENRSRPRRACPAGARDLDKDRKRNISCRAW